MSQTATVQHLNPEELSHNPAFTNVVAVHGPATTVYVGGQNAVTASGEIVGKDDIAAQTAQVLRNLEIALAAAGAGLEHVIKWNLFVVEGQPLQPGFEVFQRVWGSRPNPPVITAAFVSALAHPDFLVELDAVAVVPDRREEER
jgi:enamine deaminase RidA (YjgF/YER057c/UK114 family)